MANSFSIGDSLSAGWNIMKRNFLLFLYIILTFIALQVISNLSAKLMLGFIVVVAVMVIMMVLKLGLIRVTLDLVDNRKADYNRLLSQPNLFPDYLIATILYILVVIGGLILLVVPGIIWAVKFSLYDYYIVDKRMGPIEALKASAKATYGHKWNLFLFFLAVIGINIVGALALLVGLFATIPTSEVAMAVVYRKLSGLTPVKAHGTKVVRTIVKRKAVKRRK